MNKKTLWVIFWIVLVIVTSLYENYFGIVFKSSLVDLFDKVLVMAMGVSVLKIIKK